MTTFYEHPNIPKILRSMWLLMSDEGSNIIKDIRRWKGKKEMQVCQEFHLGKFRVNVQMLSAYKYVVFSVWFNPFSESL